MCRTKNGALRNSNINWIFLWRLFTQNQSKPSITEKRRNKAKYLTGNSIRLKFVKTSMPNPVKSLGYITYHSSSSPGPVNSPSNSIRYNYEICSWSRRPKTKLIIKKKATVLKVINNPILSKFFKDFTNHRNNTNRVVVFSWRAFPNILQYWNHWWNLSTLWKTRLLKGNPNSQGILNWIIQILHYYYSKQQKNIENSQIIEQNLVISLSVLLSIYCGLHFLPLPCSSFSVL